MNKHVKILGLLSLLCFSFYYTEQIARFMQKKDPIYETILAQKSDYELQVINGEVNNDFLTPGLVGKVVNVEKSFQKMKGNGYFSENALVFDEIKPLNSLKDNKDKKISQGNPYKNYVSIILEGESFVSFLEEMNISYAILTTKDNMATKRINGLKINNDFTNFLEVDKYLKLKKEDNSYCYIKNNHEDFCRTKKKILLEETILFNKNNIAANYKNIKAGSIIYLSENLDLEHVKLLYHQIYFKGYQVVSLDELLSESR